MRPSMAEVMRTYEKERDEESASHNSKRRKSSELEKLSMKKIADMVISYQQLNFQFGICRRDVLQREKLIKKGCITLTT